MKLNPFFGILAVIFYLFYAGHSYTKGTLSNAIWICHIGCLLVGLGLLSETSQMSATGFFLLVVGNFGWVLYLLAGGELILPSLLTHIGGILIGGFGIYKLGVPKFTFLYAVLAFALLQILARLTTNSSENVNLAFRIHESSEKYFPSYPVYLVFLYVLLTFSFYGLEFTIRKILHRLDL
jgi:hypothetical protein